MQYYYPGGRAAGRWSATVEWLVEVWKRGETTALFTDDYFVLWFPVVPQDEFPY